MSTVLVITDQPPVRFWIKKHLASVIDANNELKAISAVESSKLDLIILDDTIENALELVTKMRAKTAVPILLITGHLKKDYRTKAQQAGVTEFLSDLLDADELKAQMEKSKNNSKLQQKMKGILPVAQAKNSDALKNRVIQTAKEPVPVLIIQIDQFEKIENKANVVAELLKLIPNATSTNEGQFVLLATKDPRTEAEEIQKRIAQHLKITVSIAISKVDASSFHKIMDAASKSLKKPQKNIIFNLEFLG